MKIKDYKKEQELLGQLNALKEIKSLSSDYDEFYEAAKIYVNNAWDGKLGPEQEKHINDMVETYDDLTKVVNQIATTLRLTKDIFKVTNEEKRNMRNSTKVITDNIGNIMMDIVKDNGLIEGELNFPRFGNVKCSIKKDMVITNEQLLKESLVEHKRWDLIKTEPLSKLKKVEEIGEIEGIEEQEIPKVTISTRK